MYIAFLDEFGHIGPYVGRDHPNFGQSPVFGIAGFVMPHDHVRSFATWFFQAKNNIFSREIEVSGKHPATWEKKGTKLFTTKNIRKYSYFKSTFNRMINKIYKSEGRLLYYGREKYLAPDRSSPGGLYTTVLAQSIRRIDRFATFKDSQFLMMLDEHSDRIKLLETSAKTMFGNDPARNLIEPPFHVESHLYQTIQAADWIATIIGRLMAYRVRPDEFADWEWAERLFGRRIDDNATHSALWKPSPTLKASRSNRQVLRAGP